MQPFETHLDERGFISMKLTGSLSEENYTELKQGVEEGKRLVKEYSEKRRGMIHVLFDISEFTGTYNVAAMLLMKELSDHNRPFVNRTAIVGGSDLARIAAEVTVDLIGDPTIKQFKTTDEGLAWLMR